MREHGRAKDLFDRVAREGEAAVEEFIQTRKSEELFLDFKRSSDNGSGQRLSQGDRNNLAKAISGFANSAGGIIVWGVDCSPDENGADVARMKVPIESPERFVSWLNGAVSGCTIPPHSGVMNTAIPVGDGAKGFVVTYVPESNRAPHQVVGKQQYYIRAGSDFVPTPHQVLAGLFGRRPQPYVYPMYTVAKIEIDAMHVKCGLGIALRNDGPGVAEDLFLTAMIRSFPGKTCSVAFDPPQLTHWDVIASYGRHVSVISKKYIRLPPDAQVQPLVVRATFAPPFEKAFRVVGQVGAASAPAFPFNLESSSEQVAAAYKESFERAAKGTLGEKERWELLPRFMGMERPEGHQWGTRRTDALDVRQGTPYPIDGETSSTARDSLG